MMCEDCFSDVCIEGQIHGPFSTFSSFLKMESFLLQCKLFLIKVSIFNGFEINSGMLRSFRQERMAQSIPSVLIPPGHLSSCQSRQCGIAREPLPRGEAFVNSSRSG